MSVLPQRQQRKLVEDWTIYDVLTFLRSLPESAIVVQPSVLRVGFTGRALLMILNDPEPYWEKLLNPTSSENDVDMASFKMSFLNVRLASESNIEQLKALDMKFFGDRLVANNYFDDGVS